MRHAMIIEMGRAALTSMHRGRLRLRTVLLLGMLVPLVGVGGLAGVVAGERWAARDASDELADDAEALDDTIQFLAALAEEEVYATTLGLAVDLDLDPGVLTGPEVTGDGARLEEVRARVHAAHLDEDDPRLRSLLRELDDLRVRLDAGEAGYAEVAQLFRRLNTAYESRWRVQMREIETAADRRDLPADLRTRLRTLRESMEALAESDDRVRAALAILLGTDGPSVGAELIRATTAFNEALDRVEPPPGTAAAAALERFRSDPAAQRMEDVLDLAARITLDSGRDGGELTLDDPGRAITDGARWGVLIAELVDVAAADLGSGARDQAADDTSAAVGRTVGVVVVALVSLGLALATANEVLRPTRALQDAARRVEQGEFDLEPVPPEGPRELRATVDAFNDMAATLAAVEDHAVALSEDPDDPIHAEPLPGRTGQAMQAALDRLRSSMHVAEQHRVELEVLAAHDPLTGLLNRGAALEAVRRDLARARRDGTALLALYIDLDGLKGLNDTYGHAAGDEAICRTAEALAGATRDGDVVSRLGGDEFLVVGPVPPDGRPGVDTFAERVHAAVTDRVADLGDGAEVALGCSVGVALSCPELESVDSLIRAADVALYEAKDAGRGRVAWAEPTECRAG